MYRVNFINSFLSHSLLKCISMYEYVLVKTIARNLNTIGSKIESILWNGRR